MGQFEHILEKAGSRCEGENLEGAAKLGSASDGRYPSYATVPSIDMASSRRLTFDENLGRFNTAKAIESLEFNKNEFH